MLTVKIPDRRHSTKSKVTVQLSRAIGSIRTSIAFPLSRMKRAHIESVKPLHDWLCPLIEFLLLLHILRRRLFVMTLTIILDVMHSLIIMPIIDMDPMDRIASI